MAKIGRPPKDKYNIDYMLARIDIYIESRKKVVPILKECCLLNDWNYDYTMELRRGNDELSRSIRKILDWKEVRLEQGALTGQLEKTMAIFSLKQLGWKDKIEDDTDKTTLDLLSNVLDEVKKQSEAINQASGIHSKSEQTN